MNEFIAYIQSSHIKHMDESCRCKRTRSNQQSEMHESWHTYEWVMSRIQMSHVTHMNHYVPTKGHNPISSRRCMSHVTHVHESRHSWKWVKSHVWIIMYLREDTIEWVVGPSSITAHRRQGANLYVCECQKSPILPYIYVNRALEYSAIAATHYTPVTHCNTLQHTSIELCRIVQCNYRILAPDCRSMSMRVCMFMMVDLCVYD